MQVKEILALKGAAVYTIAPSMSLAEAVTVMNEHDIGALAVYEGKNLVGMLTFREVFRALLPAGSNWAERQVLTAMVARPDVVGPEMDVDDLRRMMVAKHIRYLPVVERDEVLGIISFHDVAKAMLEDTSFENRMLKAYIQDRPVDAGGA